MLFAVEDVKLTMMPPVDPMPDLACLGPREESSLHTLKSQSGASGALKEKRESSLEVPLERAQ